MSPSHLHSYPKTFNRWGNLRAFPLNKLPYYNLTFYSLSAFAVFMAYEMLKGMFFDYFNRTELLRKDVNEYR